VKKAEGGRQKAEGRSQRIISEEFLGRLIKTALSGTDN
jgi:hypothetical protein